MAIPIYTVLPYCVIHCSYSSIAREDRAVATSNGHNSAFRLGMDRWLVEDDAVTRLYSNLYTYEASECHKQL